MKYPKLWDGITPIGEGYIRGIQNLGLPAATNTGVEIRNDGTLGQVEARSCYGFNEVHRVGAEPITGTPFLSTWQSSRVQLMGKTIPPTSSTFTPPEDLPYFISNSEFVGDGFFVGVLANAETLGQPATVAPALVRLPKTYPVVSVGDYSGLSDAERRKASVLLASTFIDSLDSFYVVPMGWKNDAERYTFAIVTEETLASFVGPPRQYKRPRVWIGNTGNFSLTELPLGLGLDWEWDRAGTDGVPLTSLVTCTAPGRLEFLVFKPESDSFTPTIVVSGSAPFTFFYPGTFSSIPSLPGWPAGDWLPFSVDVFTYYKCLPTLVSIPVAYSVPTLVPRRPSFYVASSLDFGASWELVHRPEFEASTFEAPPFDAPIGGGVYTDIFPPNTLYPFVDGQYFGVGQVVGLEVSVNRNPDPIPFPPAPQSNRGNTSRPLQETFGLMSDGISTYALISGLDTLPAYAAPNRLDRDFADQLNGLETTPITVVSTLRPTNAGRHLYKRSGSGPFSRQAWPGDALAAEFFCDYFPPNFVEKNNAHVYRLANVSSAWTCTGSGRMAIFLVNAPYRSASAGEQFENRPVLVYGTIDGGATWRTLTIVDSDNFADFCVIEPEREGEHGSILYSARIADSGQRQLMRISQDFTSVAPYGPRYIPTRRGLVNFRKYVHPGLPGLYDEPPP